MTKSAADAAPAVKDAEKATPADTATPVTAAEPALVVFGLDEAGKAHASRFGAADAALATRAAALMRLMVLPVTTADHLAAASGLPVGRVFASGKGFVPFVKKAAYDRLRAFAEAYAPKLPAEIAAGEVAAPGAAAPTSTPATWGDITVDALVLASESDGAGWFEAVVTEDRGEDLFVLRWRDWPDVEPFPRRREHLALLPSAVAALDADEIAADLPAAPVQP